MIGSGMAGHQRSSSKKPVDLIGNAIDIRLGSVIGELNVRVDVFKDETEQLLWV